MKNRNKKTVPAGDCCKFNFGKTVEKVFRI